MEFFHEGLALGVDFLILGICIKEYMGYKKNVNLLKNAPQLPIDPDLKKYVATQKDQKVPYAVIRGTVAPIGAPIHSVMSPSVTGVLHIIKLSEHRVTRGFAGFWSEQHKLLHVSSNEIPFELRLNDASVEVVDALSAAILDLDVVYDNYEPSSLSLFDHLFGFFSGVRQRGLQTTEELLRDGSFITGVGELELDGNVLRLQPSPLGPLFLTTATKSTLIKKLEEAKSSIALKIIVCGVISTILISIILRKYHLRRKREHEEQRVRNTLEKERKKRRALSRPQNLTTDQLCVVCNTNPKEVILLPCGHVCICEDCSEKIKLNCPVCRGKINTKAAAFIV